MFLDKITTQKPGFCEKAGLLIDQRLLKGRLAPFEKQLTPFLPPHPALSHAGERENGQLFLERCLQVHGFEFS
jgi:hypothetical protein